MTEQLNLKPHFTVYRFLHKRWPSLAKLYTLGKWGFPFMLPSFNNSAMRQIRAIARCNIYAHLPPLKRYPARIAMTLTWPIGALIEVIDQLRYPQRPQKILPLLYRAWRMYALALTENVMPIEYMVNRLYEPERKDWLVDYLYWSEHNILQVLNQKTGADNNDVQDKARFALICGQHGFPCIPTLAVYQGGKQSIPDTPFLPDQPSLWVKDLAGSNGSGAGQWQWQNGIYINAAGNTQTPAELVKAWYGRNCLVQPVLNNHPRLASLSDTDNTLVVFRIVTGIEPDGKVHLITHFMALPLGGFANRRLALFCKLDDDGRILSAFTPQRKSVERHPQTGAFIADITVPYWRETLALVKLAHQQAFSRFVFLGWDVAITPDGPILIETNSGPGFFYHQIFDDIPLGHTAFTQIASQYLLKANSCN